MQLLIFVGTYSMMCKLQNINHSHLEGERVAFRSGYMYDHLHLFGRSSVATQ